MNRRIVAKFARPAIYAALLTGSLGRMAFAAPSIETIVYTSLKPDNWDIYLFENRGEMPRALAPHPALDYNAVFSPNGRWVVFTSERSGNADLYALDYRKVGAEPVQLTSHFAMDDAACFTPDGTTLVFVSNRDGFADIWRMPFRPGDKTAERNAVNLTQSKASELSPAVSPDGKTIAYFFGQDYHIDWSIPSVWLMDMDGKNRRPFNPKVSENRAETGLMSFGASPAWSRDGHSIYYYLTGDITSQIWKGSDDGKIDRPLTPADLIAWSPALMPDGRVAFAGVRIPAGTTVNSIHYLTLEKRIPEAQIWSVDESGDLRLESDGVNHYFAPDFDRSGRMLCHGPGPVSGQHLMPNLRPFARVDGRWRKTLPDGRVVHARALRGYFPALTSAGEVYFGPWLNEEASIDRYGPAPMSVANLNGSQMRMLPMPQVDAPHWGSSITRDGRWLFTAIGKPMGDATDRVDIWKIRTDGGEAINLTAGSESNSAFPDVSADGSVVVFRRYVRTDREGNDVTPNSEIFVMDGNGDHVRRLTYSPTADTMPAISPDGKWVVHSQLSPEFPDNDSYQLIVQPVDGHEEGTLLEPERAGQLHQADMHPRFSPDGKWIVFASSRGGFNDEWLNSVGIPQPYGEIWAIPVENGRATRPSVRLTYDKWENSLPYWANIRSTEAPPRKSPDSVLRSFVESGRVPGAVALAATKDRILHQGAFGALDIKTHQAVKTDTIFKIASMTKPVTSVAVMQLVEEGKVALEARVSDYLPELAHPKVLTGFDKAGQPQLREARRPPTIRELLSNTSGYAYPIWNAEIKQYLAWAAKHNTGRDRFSYPLASDPGTRWEYSPSTYVLGWVVEKVSGLTLEDYFRQRIFAPLGMADTSFQVPTSKWARVTHVHKRLTDGNYVASTTPWPSTPPEVKEFAGDSGLSSTGPDYLRFVRAFLNNGELDGKRILKPETVDLMSRNQIGEFRAGKMDSVTPKISNDVHFFPDSTNKFGLGFLINTQPIPGGRAAGSLMWGGAYNTYFWIDRRQGVGGVIMTQLAPFADEDVLEMVNAYEQAAYSLIR